MPKNTHKYLLLIAICLCGTVYSSLSHNADMFGYTLLVVTGLGFVSILADS
ncbi:MAG: hypothetical protein NVS3B25_19120 [Hymenobacter sp.]